MAAVNRMHESTDIFMNLSADNLHRPVDIPLVLHDKIFEFPVELCEVTKSHRFCDIIDIFITGNQQIGCFFHTDVRTVVMDTQPGKVFNGFVERISGIIKMRFQVCTCDFSVGSEHVLADPVK